MQTDGNFTQQQYQIMALAGLLQCCQQVRLLARKGHWNQSVAQTCIHSLFQMEAETVTDVYGTVQALAPGLRYLLLLLQKKIDRSDVEITRYAVNLLHHERRLKQRPELLNRISQRLNTLRNEFDITHIDDMAMISRIAEAYGETISTIPPKIQVEGSKRFLLDTSTVDRVRCMLFSGMRSAVLWRQLGGSRWKLFLHRKNIERETRHLLEL
jgi:high frequency lysogenization protein